MLHTLQHSFINLYLTWYFTICDLLNGDKGKIKKNMFRWNHRIAYVSFLDGIEFIIRFRHFFIKSSSFDKNSSQHTTVQVQYVQKAYTRAFFTGLYSHSYVGIISFILYNPYLKSVPKYCICVHWIEKRAVEKMVGFVKFNGFDLFIW